LILLERREVSFPFRLASHRDLALCLKEKFRRSQNQHTFCAIEYYICRGFSSADCCAYIIAAGTGFVVNYIELKIPVSAMLEFYLKPHA